jgi:hypothetical protein
LAQYLKSNCIKNQIWLYQMWFIFFCLWKHSFQDIFGASILGLLHMVSRLQRLKTLMLLGFCNLVLIIWFNVLGSRTGKRWSRWHPWRRGTESLKNLWWIKK